MSSGIFFFFTKLSIQADYNCKEKRKYMTEKQDYWNFKTFSKHGSRKKMVLTSHNHFKNLLSWKICYIRLEASEFLLIPE